MSVAKLRLADFIQEKRTLLNRDSAIIPRGAGKLTVSYCISVFRQRLEQRQDIKPGAKSYREWTIVGLLKHWPKLEALEVAKITKDDCLAWAARLSTKYAPTMYNNVVDTLRMVLDIGIEFGARSTNPAKSITKRRVVVDPPVLPASDKFNEFLREIDESGIAWSHKCGDMVRFLAFSGLRLNEAANILWGDVDFARGQINVRKEVTKNGLGRTIPIIQDMKALLEKRKAADPNVKTEKHVLEIKSCQQTMDKAAQKVGMARITHHDLRHLFATRCIESGVDIPTVSRWLGHKDGGALAMKTYGHLRNEHSQAMAQKVKF